MSNHNQNQNEASIERIEMTDADRRAVDHLMSIEEREAQLALREAELQRKEEQIDATCVEVNAYNKRAHRIGRAVLIIQGICLVGSLIGFGVIVGQVTKES